MSSKPRFVGEKVRLGDVATYVNGYAFKPSDYSDSGLPIVRIQNLTGNAYRTNRYEGTLPEKFAIQDGDILISWSASLGVFEWNQGPAWLNQHIFRVVFNKAMIDKRFFVHQARFLIQKSQNLAHGATMKHLTKKVFETLPFLYLGLNNQITIAEQLDALDTQINRAKRQIRFLDNLAKSRFVEMFGDPTNNEFDFPVEKLGGLGLLERGKSKHRPRNAPELRGGPNGPYPLIQTGDIANAGTYLATYEDTYTELGLLQSRIWPKGTLCITIAANIAKTSILAIDACFPDSVVGFTTNGKVTNLFMHYWFSFFQSILEKQAPQAAQKNINLRILQNLDAIAPPLALQQEFADFVAQVDKSRFIAQQQIEKLQMLYDSLAQDYFGD